MKHSVNYLARHVYTPLVVSQFANRMPFGEYLKPIQFNMLLFISERVVLHLGSCADFQSASQYVCLSNNFVHSAFDALLLFLQQFFRICSSSRIVTIYLL